MKNDKMILFSFVYLAIFVVSLLYLFLPIWDELKNFYLITSHQASLLTSLYGLSYASGFLLWGRMIDIYGQKKVLIFGTIALIVCTFAQMLASDFYEILAMRLVQGFFASTFAPSALSFVAQYFEKDKITSSITYISTGFLLSSLIGQNIAQTMVKYGSLNELYMLFGFLFSFGLLFLFSLPNTSPKLKTIEPFFTSLKGIFNTKIVILYALSFLLLGSLVFLYSYLNKVNLGIDISKIRLFATAFMLLPLIFKIKDTQKTLLLSVYILAISLLLQFFTNGYLFAIFHFIFITALVYAIPSIIAIISINCDEKSRGISISIYTFILFVGTSFGVSLEEFIGVIGFYFYVVAFLSLNILLYKKHLNKNDKIR